MTRRDLAARVEFWRALIVPEWRVELVRDRADVTRENADEPEEDFKASICAAEHQHYARVWVRETHWRTAPLGEVDVTVVHELLHLIFRRGRRIVDELDGLIHRDVHKLLEERFEVAEELAVERLARIIARLEHPRGILYGVDAGA